MDLNFLLDRVPMNAYNKGYGDEVQNQLHQARTQEAQQRAQQMIQEMMIKQQAAPGDIAYKDAMTQELLARAKGTGHYAKPDDSDKFADRIAKAEALSRLGQERGSRGRLEGILNAGQADRSLDTTDMLDEMMPNLPADIRSILQPSKDVSMYNDQSLETAIRVLQERDPEAAKTLRTQLIQKGQTDRQDDKLASDERRAKLVIDNKKQLLTLKQAGDKKSMENLAAQYKAAADQEKDPATKAELLQLYIEAKEGSMSIKAAGATVAADQKQATIDRVLGGRGTQGKVGAGPVTGNNMESDAIKAWGAYEPEKYDYRVSPDGKLQRKPRG